MTRIRLIATDLDGTLLDPQGDLSPRTRRAIAAAHDQGTRVVLATSRRFTGSAPIARALATVDALILYDGAQVRDYPGADILSAVTLPSAAAQRAAEIMAAHGLQPIAQHADQEGERLVAGPPSLPGSRWAESYLTSVSQQVERVPLAEVCAGRADPLRLVAFGPPRRLRAAARDLAQHFAVGEAIKTGATVELGTQILQMGSYGNAELTVFSPHVSKGAALHSLARRLDIPLAETMAIGDGVNDISMLRVAGLGVAMRKAPRAVQAAASVITGGNAEDGAAQAIERFVLRTDNSDDMLAPFEPPSVREA